MKNMITKLTPSNKACLLEVNKLETELKDLKAENIILYILLFIVSAINLSLIFAEYLL